MSQLIVKDPRHEEYRRRKGIPKRYDQTFYIHYQTTSGLGRVEGPFDSPGKLDRRVLILLDHRRVKPETVEVVEGAVQ
jgi:hypothetical protein